MMLFQRHLHLQYLDYFYLLLRLMNRHRQRHRYLNLH
jgi:hypothetical protein